MVENTGFLPIDPALHKGPYTRASLSRVEKNLKSLHDNKVISSSGKLLDMEAINYLLPNLCWFRAESVYELDMLAARRAQALTGTTTAL